MVDFKSFLPKKETENEYFWSLVIEPGWVAAGIWKIVDKSAQIIITTAPNAWELDEELISASDSSLSSAIQGFPEDYAEPSKTVFGVAASWVKGGEIREEYLGKIKNVCKELSLTPIGFVVVPEAIAHYYKSQEGSPLNAVVIGVYKEEIEVSVFKLGNLLGSTQVARSVSVADDCIEGLTRFEGGDSIPSRFIIYDGRESELEEVRQSLLKINWEDYGKFKLLHTPKVETVDEKKKLLAVSLAGGSEIANVTSIEFESPKVESIASEVIPQGTQEEKELHTGGDPEDVGFIVGRDIALEEDKRSSVSDREETNLKVVNEIPDEASNVRNVPSDVLQVPRMNKSQKIVEFAESIFKNVSSGLSRVPKIFSGKPKFSSVSSGRKPMIIGIVFLFILFIGGFLLWWFYPKAVVTIYVSPQRLEEEVEITVDESINEPDFSEKILPGEVLNTSVSGERTGETSGTKVVGEKAKGEVTLYRVGTEISLDAGTKIKGPDNLNFSLDSSVNLASGSASTPGTTTAGVTGEEIGAQYNLAGGTSFSVSNYSLSDIEAKNSSSFSGGSSREISAVAKDDQENLRSDLEDELKQSAVVNIKDGLSKEMFLIEDSITTSLTSENFSAKVGDEASNLRLSLGLKVAALVIEKDKLTELAQEVLKEKMPKGFVLRGEQISYRFEVKEGQGGKYKLEVRILANLLPEINTDAIAEMLKGTYPTVAKEILQKEVSGFARIEIKINPSLPGQLKTLPHVPGNIEVELAADK